MMKKVLLIFAKNLIYGQVKTRIAATMGNEVAIDIYQQLLRHTHSVTKRVDAEKIIFYSDFIEEDIWENDEFEKEIQRGNELGERMKNAFITAFEKKYEKVIIVGTDCPELNKNILEQAFIQLNDYDLVIGPAKDGGYYLLGMKKMHSFLFENMSWSTSKVFNDTIVVCNNNQLNYFLLPELSDLDEEKDLIDLGKSIDYKRVMP
jgi:hypothetical protein